MIGPEFFTLADRAGVVLILIVAIGAMYKFWREDRQGHLDALRENAKLSAEQTRAIDNLTAAINNVVRPR